MSWAFVALAAYYWTDAAGNLHASDMLQDVPEPYYSSYKQAEATAPAQPSVLAATATTPVPSGYFEEQERLRKEKKDVVAFWRNELVAATAQLQEVEQRLAALRFNPILAQTPNVKAQMAEEEGRRIQRAARVQHAKKMLGR